jgi:hypothetical protein
MTQQGIQTMVVREALTRVEETLGQGMTRGEALYLFDAADTD